MTFVDALLEQPWDTRRAFTFLPEAGAPLELDRLTFDVRTRAVAQVLSERFGAGDRVLVLCPPGLDYIVAFLGCVYAGVVAVPAYPPDPADLVRTLPRLVAIARDAGAVAVLTTAEIRAFGGALASVAPQLTGLPWLAVDEVDVSRAAEWRRPPIDAGSVAFLQYTSGSTADPRGVRITHANLLANSRQIAAVRAGDDAPCGVSWLPPYHDMGLVGLILQALFIESHVVLMSPLTFLRKPIRWLQAISDYHATGSACPNFALDLCVRRVTADERSRLDLSSMKYLFVGAEPIRADTLERFLAAFGPCGLDGDAIHPSYGLAESTLMLSSSRDRGPVRIRNGRVSCGRPAAEIAIVDPETLRRVPEGGSGEIWARGPQIAAGYHERDDGTFDATLDGQGGWLRTGDLGELDGGELFVTGRKKEILIRRGRKLHPHDLEATAERAHPAIRPGGVVACASATDVPGDERIAMLVEIADSHKAASVASAVRNAIGATHDVPVDDVVLVAPRGLPKTSSGKLRRHEAREAWLRGALPLVPIAAPEPATSLYGGLDDAAAAIDARPTKYQFDLETDMPWDALDAPGDYLPPLLEAFGWSEGTPLRNDPAARDVFQWAACVSLSDVVATLEEGLVWFAENCASAWGTHRSVDLLVEEERKHTALFRRYAAHLRARRPDLAEVYDRVRARVWVPLPFDSPLLVDDPLAYHYQAWLQIMFFEEWSVWFHDRLLAERDQVQPAWLAAQRLHAREEVQHIYTSDTWLCTLVADESLRMSLSRKYMYQMLVPIQASNQIMRAVCMEVFPEHAALLARPNPSGPLLGLLREAGFARTRHHAPFVAQVADRALPSASTPPPVRRVPTAEAAEAWLRAWIVDRGLHPAAPPEATFHELGLDSAEMLGLSGELDEWVGGALQPTVPYEYPTPKLLAGYLAALPQAEVSPKAALGDGPVPVSRRQARWLDVCAHQGGIAHNVCEAWTFPKIDPERLGDAIRCAAARHPAFRTRFVDDGGWAQVRGALDIDRRAVAADSLEDTLRELAAIEWNRPYRVGDPHLRAIHVQSAQGDGLVISMPHVVSDAASLMVLIQEIARACVGQLGDSPAPDPAGMASEEAAWLRGPEVARRIDWWRARLADLPDWDGAMPRQDRMEGRRNPTRWVAHATAQRWNQHARRLGVSSFVYLLSALCLAWRRVHGLLPVVGTQLSGRNTPERGEMVGFLVDVALVRADLPLDATIEQAAPRVGRAWLEAAQHAVSVDEIVGQIFPERRHQRWLPAPISFNWLAGPSQPVFAGDEPWTRRLDLVPAKRTFLYYEEMVVAVRGPDERIGFVHWYDGQRHAQEADGRLLDAFFAVLGA